MICLPDTANIVFNDDTGSIIELPGRTKLVMGRAWQTEDCTLNVWDLKSKGGIL